MKKFNDIFSVDSSTGGGKRLIKKIINKYRLGNEYKEIKENIENKGGSSTDVVYYIKKDLSVSYDDIEDLYNIPSLNVYCKYRDASGSYYYCYDMPYVIVGPNLVSFDQVIAISLTPFKIVIHDEYNNIKLSTNFDGNIESVLSVVPNFPIKDFYKDFRISTKEEIEKVMDELRNQ